MKKVFFTLTLVAATALVACGPSAADKEKAQHMADSLRNDSIAKVDASKAQAIKDSTDNAMAEQAAAAKADSIKMAEEAAAAKGGKK